MLIIEKAITNEMVEERIKQLKPVPNNEFRVNIYYKYADALD